MAFFGKKILPSIIIAAALVGGSAFFSAKSGKNAPPLLEGGKQASFNIAEIDTDGDGLKDWEERLWKTDYKNPDSDGDGASDKDEISAGRDPAVPGPNDSLDRYKKELTSVSDFAADRNLNLTDALSRAFLSEYIGAKISSGALSEDDGQSIADEIVSKRLSVLEPKVYVLRNIKTGTDNSKIALKTYAEGVSKILLEYAEGKESELSILAKAMESKNPSDLKKLDSLVSDMQSATEKLLKIEVPPDLAERHLAFINAFSAVKEEVSLFRQIFSDPVLGLLALSGYRKDSDEFTGSFGKIKDYVKSSGVIFIPEDAGYALFK